MGWISERIIDWKVRRAVKAAEQGKKGPMAKGVIEGFKSSPGYRSAVMLLLLVAEGLARQLGFDAGPLFLVLKTGFGVIGVTPDEASALGIDPSALIVALTSLWFAVARLWTVYRERKATKEAKEMAAALAALEEE